MTYVRVFEEPRGQQDGRLAGYADWCMRSDSSDAQVARQMINAKYKTFPDHNHMVLSRLRYNDDIVMQQALDELFVYHLIPSEFQARYEEDDRSPDFRIYQSSKYLAGLEVVTQFEENAFISQILRNSKLVNELNNRVSSSQWWASIRVESWERHPRVSQIASWLKSTVASLPDPDSGMTARPTAKYESREVTLKFEFVPRESRPDGGAGPLIGMGPMTAGWSQSTRRLRKSISNKVGKRYDLRDGPFAVAVAVRDMSCDTEDLVDALYGDYTVQFELENPGSARPTRHRNGTFGLSAATPDGRNRRLSCVFAVLRTWTPGANTTSSVIRFDNPFAQHPFPEDIITPAARFVPVREGTLVRMEWQETPVPAPDS